MPEAEIAYEHHAEPLTVGQLRHALARFADHTAIRVSVPEAPGSRFNDDSYIVTTATQPIATRDGQETVLDECCLEVDFPTGTYYRYQ